MRVNIFSILAAQTTTACQEFGLKWAGAGRGKRMSAKVLIIDDDAATRKLLEQELADEGYSVSSESSGRAGLEAALSDPPDLMLLEVILPGLSGMEILRRLRAAGHLMPVIIISARTETPDKVAALDQGANDYVTKPFHIEELLARIRAWLRVTQGKGKGSAVSEPEEEAHPHKLGIDSLEVNTRTRTVIRSGQPIDLTPKEFDLLVYLLERSGEVLTREELIQHVWGYDFVGDTNVTDVYIGYLRKKIDQGFKPPLIHTIRGVGFCLRDTPDPEGQV